MEFPTLNQARNSEFLIVPSGTNTVPSPTKQFTIVTCDARRHLEHGDAQRDNHGPRLYDAIYRKTPAQRQPISIH